MHSESDFCRVWARGKNRARRLCLEMVCFPWDGADSEGDAKSGKLRVSAILRVLASIRTLLVDVNKIQVIDSKLFTHGCLRDSEPGRGNRKIAKSERFGKQEQGQETALSSRSCLVG
ncbi:MAG TPA: hypothetical protein VGG81_11340 [Edaphobacter sp.]|jgi:hypothetical protein